MPTQALAHGQPPNPTPSPRAPPLAAAAHPHPSWRRGVDEAEREGPGIWGIDPVEDQQLAAVLMKVVGSLIRWGFIGAAFFKWYAEEESSGQGLPWVEPKDDAAHVGLKPNR